MFNNAHYSNQGGIGRPNMYNRWHNRSDPYYRRRYYNVPQNVRPAYIPHQRLWNQQHLMQEMYRRFMSSNYDDNRYYDYGGFGLNNNSQPFNSPWQRRG